MAVRPQFPDPKTLLKKHGMWAKKRWGQNFLLSDRAYDAMVRAAVTDTDTWLIEIGAGLGTLTMRLATAASAGRVIAVERDRELVALLRQELADYGNIDIAEANALTFDVAPVWRQNGHNPLVVCGNLPYNISSQILIHILRARAHIRRAVVMLQAEMAFRLLAEKGTKSYSSLGVLLSAYADISLVAEVPRTAFLPAPRVDSAIVQLDFFANGAARVAELEYERFSRVVHLAFQQRRKTLRNALRAGFDTSALDIALSKLAIDGRRRGETLSIAEFAALSAALPSSGKNRHGNA